MVVFAGLMHSRVVNNLISIKAVNLLLLYKSKRNNKLSIAHTSQLFDVEMSVEYVFLIHPHLC